MVLIPQTELARTSTERWHSETFVQISERLTAPSPFPCTFSQNAFKRSLLLFSFVEDSSDRDLLKSANDLLEYVEISRRWNGSINTARPLVMAFSQKAIKSNYLVDYHGFGWRVLQFWHEFDPQPWPEDVAQDPHLPFWSMCFNTMQLFVNMSCPAHSVRRSRNLGDHLLFIINPRERFDIVAGNSPEGRKVRANIRHRVESYDGIPHSLQLGSYEAGEIEWWQYGIIEENAARFDRCPFHFVDKAKSS